MVFRTKFIATMLVLCFSFSTDSIQAQKYDRQFGLDRLFTVLAQSTSEYQARQIEQLIRTRWFVSDNEQVNYAMQQLMDARQGQDNKTAFRPAVQHSKYSEQSASLTKIRCKS